jgi:hypothetical protein
MLPGVDINRYAYAGNDPINKSDPNGHWMEGRDADHLQSMSEADRQDYALESQVLRESKQAYDNYPNEYKKGPRLEYGNDARQQLRQSRHVEQEGLDTAIEYGSYGVGAGGAARLAYTGIRLGLRSAAARLAKNEADLIHSALPDAISIKNRATAVLKTNVGKIAAGGAKRDLTPAQRALAESLGVKPVKAKNIHAEIKALDAAKTAGQNPQAIGVSGQPICTGCQQAIKDSGGKLIDDFTAIWP